MSMEHRAYDGMTADLASKQKVTRSPEAIVTGIKLFDDNLSGQDLVLFDDIVNRNKILGNFEAVQNFIATASNEDIQALEEEVKNFKYCIDMEAKKAFLNSIVTHISRM